MLRVDNFNDVAKSSFEEWISFLKTGNIPDDFTAPGLPEARERLREANMSDAERLRYRSYMESMRHARSVIRTNYEDGLDKGREEGKAMVLELMAKGHNIEQIKELLKNCPSDEV